MVQRVQDLIKLPVREQIGRYKYTLEENLDAEYQKVSGYSGYSRLLMYAERRTSKCQRNIEPYRK